MTEKLKNIVSESYSLFREYKVNLPLDVCTECCLTKNQESDLVSMAVNHIPFELLYEYNTAAKTVKPNINEFKHFLPRFLDLTAQQQFLHNTAELILSRFEYYSINEWTKQENDLIAEFTIELFKNYLSNYPLPELEKIDSIIVMLYKTKANVLPILENWFSVKNRSSVLHLSDLICGGFKGENNEHLQSPFADEKISKVVFDWLNSDINLAELKPIIEEMIMNPADIGEWQITELNWAYEKLNELDYLKNKSLQH